ncbi:MAG: methylated-DNA--[protein]-cysteine S-methyltransferase [Deltaproteobacteria bacterium]|nr:methylated-DNA--[protein]-cysteine S-methyltransferase [Deltaproteobacteria bacterium]
MGGRICGIRIGGRKEAFFKELKERHGTLPEEQAGRALGRLFRLFDLYFAGRRVEFDIGICTEGTDFENRVWRALKAIPYGEVRSYADVAMMAGCPNGARAVGAACKKNPVPIVIPCHRVIASSGRIGGYSPGVDIKKAMLEIEGVSIQGSSD